MKSRRMANAFLFCIHVLLLSLLAASAQAVWQTPTPLVQFGARPALQPSMFKLNTSLGVNSTTGEIYIGDSNRRIQRFGASGNYIGQWQCGADCDSGIGINETTGEVYVARRGPPPMVSRYSASGTLLGTWTGSPGEAFSWPWDLTIDPTNGNVYVMDPGNARIQVFDSLGNFLFKFGSMGSAPGQFSGTTNPQGIYFDPTTRKIYVTEATRHKILVFAENGDFLLEWGGIQGFGEGELRWPRDLSVGTDGLIYVTDTDNERIQIFDPSGSHVGFFHGPHSVEGGPFHPRAIAINPTSGDIYVNAAYAGRVDHFDSDTSYIGSWGFWNSSGLSMWWPRGVAASPTTGDVFVFDSFNFRLKRFTAGGKFVREWGGAANADHNLLDAFNFVDNAVHVSSAGSLWIGKSFLHYPGGYLDSPGIISPFMGRIDPNGGVLDTYSRGDLNTKFDEWIKGIAVDEATGKVYISDWVKGKLQAYTVQPTLSLVHEYLPVTQPAGLALSGGYLYATDQTGNKVLKLNLDLTLVKEWGGAGTGPGKFQMNGFVGVTADADGNIYVTDPNNHRVQAFDTEGNFLGQISGVLSPFGVSFNPVFNALYVNEVGRDRIAVFSLGPACADGRDNEGDGKADFPADAGCRSATDLSEQADCQDGFDNDGDGKFDAAQDPGCHGAGAGAEGPDDTDADGVMNAADNCPTEANANQRDTNSDGFGNVCDADYNNDMKVGIPDFNTLRGQFGLTSIQPGFNPDVDCDGDGSIGIADFNCLRQHFGLPPG